MIDAKGNTAVLSNVTASSGGTIKAEQGSVVSAIAGSGGSVTIDGDLGAASATDTTVNAGGEFQVSAGQTATATTVNAGGDMSAWGNVTDTTLNDGKLTVLDGGTATTTTVSGTSASLYVNKGATAYGNTIDGGGVFVEGVVSGGTLTDGGQIIVSAGGVISSINATSGTLTVSAGGSAANTTVNAGYTDVYGTFSGGSIYNGEITIHDGGVASGVLASGTDTQGTIEVDGGTVTDAITHDNGNVTLITGTVNNLTATGGGITMSGGTLTSASFQDGGTLSATGGTIQSATFNGNGYGFASNAVLTDTQINANGNLVVYAGATTTHTTVSGANAFEAISAGGSSISAVITAGGNEYANAGATIVDPTAENGGTITIHDQGILSGATITNSGSLVIESGGTLNGNVDLQEGGTATIYPNAGGTITMDGSTNTGLVVSGLSDGGKLNTVISGFNGTSGGDSDGIMIAGLSQANVKNVVNSADGDFVTINLVNGSQIVLNIPGIDKQQYVQFTQDGMLFEVCFLAGSMIRTPVGDVTVEDIQIGDTITAYDWQSNVEVTRAVTWVGSKKKVVKAGLPDDEAGYPVRVLKDAIADGVPYKDMLITPEHCLFFEGKFVPVRMLVNGRSIFYDHSLTHYTYYHIETETHSVIWADGMLTESYLDTGNRRAFRQEGKVATLRGAVQSWGEDAGAPLCVDRAFVEPLFHKLEARENSVTGCQMPTEQAVVVADPNLHLVTQAGAIIRPMRHEGQRYSFMLPANTQSVRIVSRASRPADVIGPFVDDRRQMGVAVADVHFITAKHLHAITAHLQAEKPEGWHDTDWTDCAWTNGNAVLPLGDFTKGNMGLLSLTIRAAGPYAEHEADKQAQVLSA